MTDSTRCPECGWRAFIYGRVRMIQHKQYRKLVQRHEERRCLHCNYRYATLDGVTVIRAAQPLQWAANLVT